MAGQLDNLPTIHNSVLVVVVAHLFQVALFIGVILEAVVPAVVRPKQLFNQVDDGRMV